MISKTCVNKSHLSCGADDCTCTCHTWLPNADPLIKWMLGDPPGMKPRGTA